MKKLTDQELDAIFKAAEEGFHPPFDPAAWEDMAERLNQPKRTMWKRWVPLTLLGIAIFSFGVWVGTHVRNDAGVVMKESSAALQHPESDQTTTVEGKSKLQGSDLQTVEEKRLPDKNGVDEITGAKKILKAKMGTSDNREEMITKRDRVDRTNHQALTALEQNNGAATMTTDEPGPTSQQDISHKIPPGREIKTVLQQQSLTETSLDSVKNELKDQQVDSTLLAVRRESEEKEKQDLTPLRSLSIRALVSPDFSSIPNASASSIGTNYAVLAEYQFASRWSISTGAIWSDKKYASNHEVTYGNYTADRLEGSCNILDIPLNIYYRFPSHFKTSFYAGAGFSSYIMMHEAYTYTVSTGYGDRYYSTSVDGKNNEWFKVFNLSIGVEHRLSNRWSLQAEPFFKAPLGDIGEQGVRLSSAGIFFGLKYKIN